jgi:hypothetical protein
MRSDVDEGLVCARLVVGQARDATGQGGKAAGTALHDFSIARIRLCFQATNSIRFGAILVDFSK